MLDPAARFPLETFYRHFASKDELLLAMIERTIAATCMLFKAGAEAYDDPLDRLRFYVITVVASAAVGDPGQRRFVTSEHYRLHQLFPDELAATTRAFTDLLIPEIEAAAAAGHLASTDVDADAAFVTELVMATYHRYAFEAVGDLDAVAEKLWAFCLRALGGAEGAGEHVPTPSRDGS